MLVIPPPGELTNTCYVSKMRRLIPLLLVLSFSVVAEEFSDSSDDGEAASEPAAPSYHKDRRSERRKKVEKEMAQWVKQITEDEDERKQPSGYR